MQPAINKSFKAIVFDFDGVIVRRSEEVKHEVWFEIFPPDDTLPRDVMEAIISKNSGEKGNRTDIARELLRARGVEGTDLEEKAKQLAEQFTLAAHLGVLKERVVTEDRQALALLSNSLPLFINSSTPEAPLKRLVESLGVAEFFKGIFGQPSKKLENLERTCLATALPPALLLFVGDGEHDWLAAKACGSAFIGIANSRNGWREPSEFPLLSSISELPKYLGL